VVVGVEHTAVAAHMSSIDIVGAADAAVEVLAMDAAAAAVEEVVVNVAAVVELGAADAVAGYIVAC